MKDCKFCGHSKEEHRGSSSYGVWGICVNGYKNYGYEIYGHCGCLPYVPKWKFWIRKQTYKRRKR